MALNYKPGLGHSSIIRMSSRLTWSTFTFYRIQVRHTKRTTFTRTAHPRYANRDLVCVFCRSHSRGERCAECVAAASESAVSPPFTLKPRHRSRSRSLNVSQIEKGKPHTVRHLNDSLPRATPQNADHMYIPHISVYVTYRVLCTCALTFTTTSFTRHSRAPALANVNARFSCLER